MKKIKFTLAIGTIIAAFSSCSTNMYMSNTVNAPLLKEKGEVKLNVTSSDIQTAVAVSDHVGVMLNGFHRTYTANNNYEHKGGLVEAGIGYYKPMTNNPLILEGFVGFGAGKVSKSQVLSNGSETYTASFDAKANKFFVQPEIGYAGKVFDIAFTPKFSFVKYTHFNSTNYNEAELAADFLDNGQLTRKMFVFAEPALTARIGYKWIKLQAQYGITTNLSTQKIRYSGTYSSLGLVFDLAKWYND